MLSTTVAGNWHAAASTVTYPLCKIPKSAAHKAPYLYLGCTKWTLNWLGRWLALLWI